MYSLYIVRRTQIYIDEGQRERIAQAAERDGVTMSALIRQAIDAYLDEAESDDARLERFRTAVADAAGSVSGLPTGEEYVDALRPDYGDREEALWGAGR